MGRLAPYLDVTRANLPDDAPVEDVVGVAGLSANRGAEDRAEERDDLR